MLGSGVLRRHVLSSCALLSQYALKRPVSQCARHAASASSARNSNTVSWQAKHAKQGTPLPASSCGLCRLDARCRSLRTSVVCSADPPKTVRDIVRELKKGDVTITFARSGGAGGQNVNKVNTKVDMRLNVGLAGWISEDLKDALQRQEKKRINKEGELVVTSTATRSQADNVEDALEKLQTCIDNAAQSLIPVEVDPEKIKQMAKQKRIANETRIENKKKTADKKQSRRAKIEW